MQQIEDSDTQRPSRREFCRHACQAASLVAASALLPACSGNSTSPSGAVTLPTINAGAPAAGALTLTIDGASPLAAVGSAAVVQSAAGNLLVSRTAQETFAAVTAVCTHESCTVTGIAGQIYVCPCHGSQFSATGGVLKGPAVSPLRQFTTRFAANVLTITL